MITQPETRRADLMDLYPEAEISIVPAIENRIGCSNRRLNSDLLNNMTTGGLHGKDIFKASVAIPIYLFVISAETNMNIRVSCQAGDTYINNVPYAEIVEKAKEYVDLLGGFEKMAEWGLYQKN